MVVGRTEQEAFDEEFLPLGLMTWNVLNDTCVDLNDNQANIVMSSSRRLLPALIMQPFYWT